MWEYDIRNFRNPLAGPLPHPSLGAAPRVATAGLGRDAVSEALPETAVGMK